MLREWGAVGWEGGSRGAVGWEGGSRGAVGWGQVRR